MLSPLSTLALREILTQRITHITHFPPPLSTLALREVLAQRIASLAMDQLLTVWLPLADEAAGGGAAVPPLGRDGPVGGTGGTSGDPAGTGRSEEAGYSGWPAGGDRMEREGWREMMTRWGIEDGDAASRGTAAAAAAPERPAGGLARPDLATATRRLLLQKALAAEPPQQSQRDHGGGDGTGEGGRRAGRDDAPVGQKPQQQREGEGSGGRWAWVD